MRAPIAALLALLSLLAPVALARPAAEQHLGATLVERGSAHYRFEHFELASADGQRHYRVRLGIPRRAAPASGYPVLYLLGLGAEIVILSAIFYFIPVGRTALPHALIGGFFTASAWEVIRHLLVWYFSTLSSASVVYGSLTTAVIALFSMEIIASLLLLGAQVISEYEQLDENPAKKLD